MDLIFILLGRIFKPFFNLLLFSYLTYSIPQSELGLYIYIITVFSIFTPFISFGTENFVIVKFNKDNFFNIYSVFFLTSVIYVLCILSVVFLFTIDTIFIFAFALFGFVYLFMPFEYLERSKGNIVYISKVNIIILSISFLLKLIVINLFDDIVLFLVLLFFLDFLTPFILFLRKKYYFSDKTLSECAKGSIDVYKFSLPFFLSTFSIVLINKIDHLMIPYYTSLDELAYYSSAYKIYEGVFIIQVLFISVFFPFLSKYSLTNSLKIIGLYANMFMSGVFLLILILSFCGRGIFLIMYDVSYEYSYILLQYLLIGIFLSFFGAVFTKLAALKVKGGVDLLKANIISLIFNVLLNHLLIPEFGVEGAVIATLFSQLIGSVLIWFYIEKYRDDFILVFGSFISHFKILILKPKLFFKDVIIETNKMVKLRIYEEE